MRFANDICPECGEHVSGITEPTRIFRGLERDNDGNYDYDGRYLDMAEAEGTFQELDGQVVVECEEGHQWETAVLDEGNVARSA
jgi:hypothetical protein